MFLNLLQEGGIWSGSPPNASDPICYCPYVKLEHESAHLACCLTVMLINAFAIACTLRVFAKAISMATKRKRQMRENPEMDHLMPPSYNYYR